MSEAKSMIITFNPFTDRICCLRLRKKYKKIKFLNFYATRKDATFTKKNVYKKLDKRYEAFLKYNTKIVLNNANAKIDRKKVFKPSVEQCRHAKNNLRNGQFLINFATKKSNNKKTLLKKRCT